jgi:alkanesulfonate monooxygenase SsuD/methylene tetrahydromethanopterin reductase-like flavin-dependent oxidoreductase (luciferase family)
MKIGVVFPQTEIGRDPAVIRDYAQAVEAMGYTHIFAFDSVVKRIEEQLDLMRLLWTRDLVRYEGRFHRVPDAGINPLPVQQPIPVWMGGDSEVVIRRAARLADGWITLPSFRPDPAGQQTVDRLQALIREAGRDPAAFGIEARMALATTPVEQRANDIAAWRAMRGITHLCVNTMGLGLPGPEAHVGMLERFKKDVLSSLTA